MFFSWNVLIMFVLGNINHAIFCAIFILLNRILCWSTDECSFHVKWIIRTIIIVMTIFQMCSRINMQNWRILLQLAAIFVCQFSSLSFCAFDSSGIDILSKLVRILWIIPREMKNKFDEKVKVFVTRFKIQIQFKSSYAIRCIMAESRFW